MRPIAIGRAVATGRWVEYVAEEQVCEWIAIVRLMG
jgi:hypothetical protein